MDRRSLHKTWAVMLFSAVAAFCLSSCSGLPWQKNPSEGKDPYSDTPQNFQTVTVTFSDDDLLPAVSEETDTNPIEKTDAPESEAAEPEDAKPTPGEDVGEPEPEPEPTPGKEIGEPESVSAKTEDTESISESSAPPAQITKPADDKNVDAAKKTFRDADSCRKAAEAGDSDAMAALGFLYMQGKEVNLNYVEARNWFQKAADLGCSDGLVGLGCLSYWGYGVGKDVRKAADYFLQAAEAGNADGMYYYALVLYDGLGIAQDYKLAAEWFEKAAEGGNTDAMRKLARMYERGWGVEKDPEEAKKWNNRASRTSEN